MARYVRLPPTVSASFIKGRFKSWLVHMHSSSQLRHSGNVLKLAQVLRHLLLTSGDVKFGALGFSPAPSIATIWKVNQLMEGIFSF